MSDEKWSCDGTPHASGESYRNMWVAMSTKDEVARLRDRLAAKDAEIERLRDWHGRALKIIANAIMHGMPITEEVAAVRNFQVKAKGG